MVRKSGTRRNGAAPAAVLMMLLAGCSFAAHTAGDGGAGTDAQAFDAPTRDTTGSDRTPVDVSPTNQDVEVVITADNAYSFGYGDETGIVTYFQGTRALTAGQIFNCPVGDGPERYIVPAASAPAGSFLYVVSWDDLAVTQGVLGQFKRGGSPIYTGDPAWQVCATGVDLSASQVGPTQAEVNAQITICNSGSGDPATTSAGWVSSAGAVTAGAIGTVAPGEVNTVDSVGDFQQVCPASQGGIDEAARWMWYNPGGVSDPFVSTGSNTFRAYLIFRLPADVIPIVG